MSVAGSKGKHDVATRGQHQHSKQPQHTASNAGGDDVRASSAQAGADNPSLTINELRSEISMLRGQLRMLRHAHAELERLAVQDTLTPLFNRRHFTAALAERLARAQRYSTKAAVLFIDVNRMKVINDVHGHSAGDLALIHVASVIQAHIRATDVAARMGGDEFAIILEQVDEQQADIKAEQLSEVLRQTPCRFGEVEFPVTASIGLAMLHPNDTEEALIERADADMYRRKRAWHEGQPRKRTSVRRAGNAAA